MIKTKSKILSLAPILVFSLATPAVAHAACSFLDVIPVVGDGAACLGDLMIGMLYGIGYALGAIFGVLGSVLNFVFGLTNPASVPAIKQIWTVTRDLANLCFGIGMIAIALGSILEPFGAMSGYGWKKTLPRLIVAALLINFSFIIGATIVDAAGVLTAYFLKPLTQVGDLARNLANGMRIHGVFQSAKAIETGGVGAGAIVGGKIFLSAIAGVIMMAVGVLVFLTGIIFMIVRTVYIWVLLAFSPIIWICWIFPATETYWKKWWETFLKWVFFAPVYVFLIWAAFYVISGAGTVKNPEDFANTLTNIEAVKLLKSEVGNVGITEASGPLAILNFAFFVFLMFFALYAAQSAGMHGAQGAMKVSSFVKGIGLKKAERWAARGAPLWKVSSGLRRLHLNKAADSLARFGDRIRETKLLGKWGPQLGTLRKLVPTLASPSMIKHAYSAISARADEESFAGAGGRLEDAWYGATSLGRKRTTHEEREIEHFESAAGKEDETATTEEQMAAVFNEVLPGALRGNARSRARLINILEKAAAVNGINTIIAGAPEEFKEAIKNSTLDILNEQKQAIDTGIAGVRREAASFESNARAKQTEAAAARAAGDARRAGELEAEMRDFDKRSRDLNDEADEKQLMVDRGGEMDQQIEAVTQGKIHQGYFLRGALNSALGGETARAGRVANDVAVVARNAGNHSMSGMTKMDPHHGEFEWNDYYSMKSETAGQFKKGQPQANMRSLHPDWFMRDDSGRLTTSLSTHGFGILSKGLTYNHIREIHQMRPETSEHLVDNFEAVIRQLPPGSEAETNLIRSVAGILRHQQDPQVNAPHDVYEVIELPAPGAPRGTVGPREIRNRVTGALVKRVP